MKGRIIYIIFSILIVCFGCTKNEIPTKNNHTSVCTISDDEQKVVDEISKRSFYISSIDSGVTEIQLDPLSAYLGETKLVGLGEATHGTYEFFEMKSIIFKNLVVTKNFKAIIFEIPWGNAKIVNDYVVFDKGELNDVIDQTYYWVYDTQEVRDLAEWMHTYNLNKSFEDRIHFVGCDPQRGDFNVEFEIVYNYLDQVAKFDRDSVLTHYAFLPNSLKNYASVDKATKEANKLGTERVYNYLLENRNHFVEISSPYEFEVALMASHVIQHRELVYRIGDSGVTRDSLMAEYSAWWQHILSPDAKVAIWAHNSHVMDGSHIGARWMGTFLRNKFGNDYKNVMFSFGYGSFNAFLADASRSYLGPVQRHEIIEPACHTINHMMSKTNHEQYYLIFENMNSSILNQYFNNIQPFIQCGAGFNYEFEQNYKINYALAMMWDVVIHFNETRESQLR